MLTLLHKRERTVSEVFRNLFSVSGNRTQLRDLLRHYPTPFFVIDPQKIIERYKSLTSSLYKYWGFSTVAYSFKTNYTVAKTGLLKREGAWAEVVSGREYALAKKLGYQGKQIIFNGPIKTDTELLTAIRDGALIHVDNFSELKRILKFSKKDIMHARVGLRISSEVPNLLPSRFGFPLGDGSALAALKLVGEEKMLITSLHMHIGSDVDTIESYRSAAEQLAQFCAFVEYKQKHPVNILDMGGGYTSLGLKPFRKRNWLSYPIEKYIETLTESLKKGMENHAGKNLIVEPGRYLVDDSGLFISKIYDVKSDNEKQKVLIDGAVTMLPLKYYRPQIIKIFSLKLAEKRSQLKSTQVFGGTCREDDIISEDLFPAANVNDYMIFYCVGAYNGSMGSDFIFGKIKTFVLGGGVYANDQN